MVEKIEDLNLPNAVVARIIKDALPDGAAVAKDAKAAIARAASVFVIFLTSTATTLARKQNHKTITAANILEALKELEFESFVDPLNADLEAYRKVVKEKKDSKAKTGSTASTSAAAAAAKGNSESGAEQEEDK